MMIASSERLILHATSLYAITTRTPGVEVVVAVGQVNTGHLFFFNQLFARPDPLAVAAEGLTAALNVNM